MKMRIRQMLALAAACAVAEIVAPSSADAAATNVIYLVADGAGYNTYAATGYFNGNFGSELVRGPGWINFGMSTYRLRPGTNPGSTIQDPNDVYDPAKQWNTAPTGTTPLEFEGYAWTNSTAPDSANTISASMTGVKTYNNAVNVNGAGIPVATFAQLASQQKGMKTGIVTTVQWADATPAAMSGISNITRNNRTQVADQILNAPYINVVMGAGNPDYTNDGTLRGTPDNTWVSSSTWTDLKDGDATGHSANWQLIQDKVQFDNLANGTLVPDAGKKILGMVKSFDGKQQYRSANGGLVQNYTTLPGQNLKTDVPELSTMTQGALRLLENPNGFFLGIEQGEVDRAMHSNHLGRMIEAQNEFNATVAFVDAYLNGNAADPNKPNYANTLVIVTADHDHLLLGPQSDTVAYQDLANNGAGNLPGALFQTGSHSNSLIPIFAKGAGSELLAGFANQMDAFNGMGHGAYMDQAELFHVFLGATQVVPEPAGMVASGVLGLGALLRRRRA